MIVVLGKQPALLEPTFETICRQRQLATRQLFLRKPHQRYNPSRRIRFQFGAQRRDKAPQPIKCGHFLQQTVERLGTAFVDVLLAKNARDAAVLPRAGAHPPLAGRDPPSARRPGP